MYSSFYFEIKEDARKKLSSKKHGESHPCLVLSMSVRSGYFTNEHTKLEYKDKDNEPLEAQVERYSLRCLLLRTSVEVSRRIRRRKEKRAWDEQEKKVAFRTNEKWTIGAGKIA